MEEIAYINGKFMALREAKISIMDYGFLYGYGLFETMRAYHGVVFRLESHLKRLATSAEYLKIPVNISELESIIREIIRINGLEDARVRLAVSVGEGSPVPDLRSCHNPTVFVAAIPYSPYNPEIYDKGYRIIVSANLRCSQSFLFQMKTANYLENLLVRQEAKSNGADDALMLNEKSYITETSTSNIFLSVENTLKTPRLKNGLLPGVTRGIVLDLAAQNGISTSETDIRVEELSSADEIFLTNSIMEIMPVTIFNGKTVAAGRPGLITQKLRKLYKEIVDKETSDKRR